MISKLFLTSGIGSWIMDGFRAITFWIDKGIYYLSKVAYEVFYSIASARLLTDDTVYKFTQRIYAILGILMIFILAWNLLNYIVDPDKISDKKVGASSIIKDVVIAIIILAILPQVFDKLYALQHQILSSNVISNLIIGGYADENEPTYLDYYQNKHNYSSYTQYLVKNGAKNMVANVYAAFVYPDDGTNYTVLNCPTKNNSSGTNTGSGTSQSMNQAFDSYCKAYSDVKSTGDIEYFEDHIYRDDYMYMPLISTAGGVVLLFFMISFCLNLAIRAGKLALLQLIAPIPVVMELLPNKKGTRKHWLDTLIKVYCEVFLYQAVIYITIFLISLIPSVISTLFASGGMGGIVSMVATVFMIFGLLQFAKEAPQMIFDLFGIKGTGTISGAAKRALAMAGVTGGLLTSSAGRFAKNFNADSNQGLGKRLLSGFAGAGSGAVRTLWGSRNVHSFSDARNLTSRVNRDVITARVNRSAYTQAHGGVWGSIRGHASDIVSDFRQGSYAYFHGNSSAISDIEYNMLDRLSRSTSAAKIDVDSDSKYNGFRSRYNNLRTTEFLNDFEAYRSLYNPNASEDDYINWMKTSTDPNAVMDKNRYSAIIDAKDSMNAREAEMRAKNIGKLQIAAQETRALVEANLQLKNLTDSQGNSLFSRLQSCINENGALNPGVSVSDLQGVIDDYNKAIGARKTEIQISNAGDRIREEQRQNRNNSSGGNGSGKK